MISRSVTLGLVSLVLSACSSDAPSPEKHTTADSNPAKVVVSPPVKRWYDTTQVGRGAQVFQETCAACHGKQGEGAPSWRKLGPDGKYPAPPLNGTGHAWHHPLKVLFRVIKKGSPGGLGNMPAWDGKLSDEEMIAAIAWIQAQWSEDIYSAWIQRELISRKTGG